MADSNHWKQARISYEKWIEQYQPMPNHIETNAPYGGFMFETYGREEAYVRSVAQANVWTLLDCDGKLYISEGYHHVNRMGYFVTKIPAKANLSFCIKAD
jgi:hypothetical protein